MVDNTNEYQHRDTGLADPIAALVHAWCELPSGDIIGHQISVTLEEVAKACLAILDRRHDLPEAVGEMALGALTRLCGSLPDEPKLIVKADTYLFIEAKLDDDLFEAVAHCLTKGC